MAHSVSAERYGVTAGYVRSQGVPDSFQSSHFDVIVYDQLEAPTLWTEEKISLKRVALV